MKMKKWLSGVAALSAAMVLATENVAFQMPLKAIAADDPLIVVSLGDSYSSGEGIEPYYDQSLAWDDKVDSQDWLAHRSTKSWPGRLQFSGISGSLSDYNVKHPASGADLNKCKWYFVATSGAKTKHMTNKQHKEVQSFGHWGYVGAEDRYIDPQFDILDELGEDVDYVTMSIGGNDVGFTDIVTTCVTYNSYLYFGDSCALDDQLNQIVNDFPTVYKPALENTYLGIQQRAPQAEIIIAGYPHLLHADCASGTVFNAHEIYIVNSKIDWFNDQLEDLVNQCRQNYNMKIHYVSVIDAFAGHEAYAPTESDRWINDIHVGSKDQDLKQNLVTSASSMHPNNSGAQAYANCVNAKIAEIEAAASSGSGSGSGTGSGSGSGQDRIRPATITGSILRADTNRPLNATVKAYPVSGSNTLQTKKATASGSYSFSLPAGSYRLEMIAPGYTKFTLYVQVNNNDYVILPTCKMVKGSTSQYERVSGRITDSVTGQGIPNALVYAKRGWNNPGVTANLAQATTDANGYYSMMLPIGNYTIYGNKANYINGQANVLCTQSGASNQNISMSPETNIGDIRIVLEWGQNPRDLDSHMVGRYNSSSSSTYHVYYGNKSAYDGSVEICNLDVDDTTSYGPETITLNPTTSGAYYYYIHHYAGEGTIATSGATIKVYQGQNLVKTFNVPAMQGSGIYWNVFAYKNGEFIVNNTITSSPNTTYAG